MPPLRWLILADDLTGAADCAIAFAKRGHESVVTWNEAALESGAVGDVPVVAIDADTRQTPAAAAAGRQRALLEKYGRTDRLLFKKIDSTLRGQPAAETAALIAHLRKTDRSRLAFVAPAFPATGRTTEAARVMVDGRRLESTPLWARDHTYESGYLPDVLKSAGLRAGVIPRDQVRRGVGMVRGVVTGAMAEGCQAVVCDAVTEDDLKIAAEATLPLADRLLFVGTGGLAAALAGIQSPAGAPSAVPAPRPGHVLLVVGSLAEVSRAGAERLAADDEVCAFTVPEALLLDAPGTAMAQRELTAEIGAALAERDVLVQTEVSPQSDLARGGAVAARLAALVAPAAAHAAALVATGGDTVRALLDRLGVTGIRLADEVEPGVPLGLTVGATALPIATKAGGFGTDQSLAHCLDRLHEILGRKEP